MRVSLLVFDDCVASIVTGLIDVFVMANRLAGRLVVDHRLVSVGGSEVRSSSGVVFETSQVADDEWLLVPGLDHDSIEELSRRLERCRDVTEAVRLRRLAGGCVGSCCSGAFLLAAAGVLDDRPATTSWWLAGELARRAPTVRVCADRTLVADGQVITVGAVTACYELALELVALADSEWLASRVASVMLIDREREIRTRYTSRDIAMRDRGTTIALADAWLQLHLADSSITVAALAEACLVSERTLLRRFRRSLNLSPEQYLCRLRMERAKQLLESSLLPTDIVANRCGYTSTPAFRRAFVRETGATPGRYRKSTNLVCTAVDV